MFRFVGHAAFAGREPAFLGDIAGLIIGPLFGVAEAGFLRGMRMPPKRLVEARAGTMRPGATAAGQSFAKL